MLAAPYTKWHCSQWNVDQAAAFVLCSTETADRAGVPDDRRVYPVAAVESNHMLPISRRALLHRAPAARAGAERLAELTGIDVATADVIDLYSCFPAAVRIQALELGLPFDQPEPGRSRRGGMTWRGAASSATLALARMVERLGNPAPRPADLHQQDDHQARSLWSTTRPSGWSATRVGGHGDTRSSTSSPSRARWSGAYAGPTTRPASRRLAPPRLRRWWCARRPRLAGAMAATSGAEALSRSRATDSGASD
jgi:acetyl-CoA C-acetyltransferase